MRNYIVSVSITLVASFGAVHMNQWFLGFVLFILAVTPLPVMAGSRLYHSVVHAMRRF